MERTSKGIDWHNFLECHSIFHNLETQVISRILDTQVATEKKVQVGEIIIRQGEIGKKVFLIGSGIVKAVLKPENNDKGIDLITMEQGELFGEMALLDDKPRSATARAASDCTILEIDGAEFHKIVKKYPDIELKLLSILSKRVRQINDKILDIQHMAVDAKLDIFNSKLNSELKVFDATLDAAQAVFDQTNIRTNEVITSTERTQSQTKLFITSIGTIFTMMGIVLGWFGLNQYNNLITAVETIKVEVEQSKEEVEQSKKQVRQSLEEIAEVSKTAQQVKPVLDKVSSLSQTVSQQKLYQFKEALDSDNQNQAVLSYENLLKSDTYLALKEIESKILQKDNNNYQDHTHLLALMLDSSDSFEDKVQVYFLLLSNAILINREQFKNGQNFEQVFSEFKQYIQVNSEKTTTINLSSLETAFAKQTSSEQKRAFARLKQLVPNP